MLPKFFDTHGHPNFVAYKDDRDEVIRRALDAGVWMNIVGTQKDTSLHAVDLAEKYEDGVFATIGLHPIHTSKSFHDEEELGPSFAEATEGKGGFTSRGEEFDYDYYKKLAMSPRVVAIGECGLDFFRLDSEDSSFKEEIEKQERVFRKQIELAIEVKKPLMLHLRSGDGVSAYKEAYKILTDYKTKNIIGNLHFFAGNLEETKLFLDMGFYFSFTGVITFARNYDEIIRHLPKDKIMSETDCPYVTPIPWRGERNEPLFVQKAAEKIAEIRGVRVEDFSLQLAQNAISFFELKDIKKVA